MSVKETVLRRLGQIVSGRSDAPSVNRLVRYSAAKAYADGDLKTAKRLYQRLPERLRGQSVRLRLGVIAEREGDLDEAFHAYSEVADSDPLNGEAAYRAGRLLQRRCKATDAAIYFSRAIASGVKDPRYSEQLLACLPNDIPHWRRLEVLRAGLTTHEKDSAWLREMLGVEQLLGREEEAKETLKAISAVTELTADESFLCGVHRYEEGDRAGARRLFDEACAAAGSKAQDKGPAFFAYKKEDWRLAAQLVESFPGARMSRSDIAYEIGYCHERLYEHESARRQYALAASLDLRNGYRQYKFGLSAERAGDFATAERAYSKALSTAKHPTGNWWNYRRAVSLTRLGRHEEALRSFWAYLGFPSCEVGDDEEVGGDVDGSYIALMIEQSAIMSYQSPSDLVQSVLLSLRSGRLSSNEMICEIQRVLPIVLKGDKKSRRLLAGCASGVGDHALACEVLEHAEEFGCKDGMNPDMYGRTGTPIRDIRYAEALETLPIAPHLVLWESNHGASIGCHPLAMFRWMVDRPEYSHLIHVWAVNDCSGIPRDVMGRPNVVFVKLHSQEYMQYLATAAHIINNVSFAPYFVRRPGQKYLNTWHGTPFKTLGRSMRGGFLEYENIQRNFQLSTLVMAPNSLTEWALIEDHDLVDVYRGRTAILGSPRLDVSIGMSESDKNTIRRRLGLLDEDRRKLVLFAPTWRGGVSERELDKDALVADLKAMASRKDVLIVYRAHRLSEKLLAGVEMPVSVVPRDIDTNEILAVVDVLVTDYSSIFFDYLPQRRPVVLYMHDIEQYRKDRGLYLDLDEVPGIHCFDREGLKGAIDRAVEGEGTPSEAMIRRYCPMEDGRASERLVRLLFEEDDVSDKNMVLRDYSTDNGAKGKKTILFHASMIPNGIASAFLALMNSLGRANYSVSLVVEPKILRANHDRAEVFKRLPRHVHVICRTGTAPSRIEEKRCIAEYSRRPTYTADSFWSPYWAYYERESRRLMGDFVPDAVVEYDGYSETWLSLAAAWGRRGAYVSCYQHNQMVREFKNKYPNLMRVFALYHCIDSVIAVSPGLALHNSHSLSRLGIDVGDRQRAARNILDHERVRECARQQAPKEFCALRDSHDFMLVNVARMSGEKNQMSLINAVADVRRLGHDVGLAVIGSGLLEGELTARIVSLGLEDHVKLLGQLANPYSAISRADAFILPSCHEGQPVTILEAMTLGVGVIASNVPGSLELLEQGYGFVCGTTRRDIADAIIGVIKDPDSAHGVFSIEAYEKVALNETCNAVFGEDPKSQG